MSPLLDQAELPFDQATRTRRVRGRHERRIVQAHPEGESRVKPEFKSATDVKEIIRRHVASGFPGIPGTGREALYGDYSAFPSDYLEAFNRVHAAKVAFAELPATVRDACGNDPARLVELVTNPANREAAIAAGLFPAPVSPPGPAPTPAPEAIAPPGAAS